MITLSIPLFSNLLNRDQSVYLSPYKKILALVNKNAFALLEGLSRTPYFSVLLPSGTNRLPCGHHISRWQEKGLLLWWESREKFYAIYRLVNQETGKIKTDFIRILFCVFGSMRRQSLLRGQKNTGIRLEWPVRRITNREVGEVVAFTLLRVF